ncbi:hypothetical protein [Streptomyces sp. NPDC059761]|uniref:hypothetical protein n=1 Tax=Streptomyces sp. NPDC059761 TaxID=3346937 RepID=UPI0036573627
MDDLYYNLDEEKPYVVRRTLGSRVAFWAAQVRKLNPQDTHITFLADGLQKAAEEIDAGTDPFEELPSIAAARKALDDLRNSLQGVRGDVTAALAQTDKAKRQKRELHKLTTRLDRVTRAHQSTIVEARRQANRAERAEQELAQLKEGGGQ